LRFFTRSAPVVRLPALPRRLSYMAALVVFFVGLILSPFLVNEMVRTRMNEAVQQAIMLAQISHMHDFEGRRPKHATQALPLIGFEIAMAESTRPMQSWLVMEPRPTKPVRIFNLKDMGQWQTLQTLWWIVTCPPDAVFALRNTRLSGGAGITAMTTTGLFQANVGDAIRRISISIFASIIVLSGLMQIVVRRLMLRGLDDLFVRLYGSAALQSDEIDKDDDLAASLDAFQERLRLHIDEQARLASLGAGASFLAHNMRNLLASLQINAEQLEQMSGQKERRIGKRLSVAIEQALSLAEWATLYTSHKRDNLDVSKQKLAPIVADALNFVRLHDPKRKVDIVNECDREAEVVAEPTLMFRIVYNLALNALQSMKGQVGTKRITIEARSDATACTLYVSDTGPGLPNAGAGTLLMPHMGGVGRPDGTGLGLKIVVDLLSWHGGKIEVARADSHGTHFKITIPHNDTNAPRDDVLEQTAALDAVGGEG
jgi:signal transduction histidine kinase